MCSSDLKGAELKGGSADGGDRVSTILTQRASRSPGSCAGLGNFLQQAPPGPPALGAGWPRSQPAIVTTASAPAAIDWRRLARLCRQILPTRAVVSAPQELLSYDCDGLTLHRHAPPLVVLPESRDQVAALVSLCAREGVPFIARGSGTEIGRAHV